MSNEQFQMLINLIDQLLLNIDLEIEIVSNKNDYKIVYSTTLVAKDIEKPTNFTRRYWLELINDGAIMDAPWDQFVHSKQVGIIINLITLANYSVAQITEGWLLRCPKCDQELKGKIWRSSPKCCESMINHRRCGYEYKKEQKRKIVFELSNKEKDILGMTSNVLS